MGDGVFVSTTSKIEPVEIIYRFCLLGLIRITFDDRHSRPSLLARFHLPRNMYYVSVRGTKRVDSGLRQMVRRETNSGDGLSCGRRVVHDLNPRQTYRGPSTLFKSLWRGCGFHRT